LNLGGKLGQHVRVIFSLVLVSDNVRMRFGHGETQRCVSGNRVGALLQGHGISKGQSPFPVYHRSAGVALHPHANLVIRSLSLTELVAFLHKAVKDCLGPSVT
jgi:hypothetical protein